MLALFGLLSAAISFCYLRAVQSYIPFAAAQLYVTPHGSVILTCLQLLL